MISYFKGKNVLITGGLGFLGSSLAHQLLPLEANITVIDNLDPLYGGNLYNIKDIANQITVVNDDVRNVKALSQLVERAEIIFHFAAQVSYIDSVNIPYDDLDLNARATLNILECCKKLNPTAKIVFSSSRMIYGKMEQDMVDETCATNPLSLYGIHKLTSEKYLLMYYKDFGIPTTVLRLTNPYGPRQQIKHDKYSLVGWFIRQAMEGKTIKIFGEGAQLRDYIFVDDIVNAMLKCAAEPMAVGEVINVGSGISTRFCDMVAAVVECVGNGKAEFVPWPVDYERIETGDATINISKLKRLTGCEPGFTLKEGIAKTFEYYKQHSQHYI